MEDYNGGFGGIGTGGGKGKGKNIPNQRKLDVEAQREQAKKTQQDGERAESVEEFPIPKVTFIILVLYSFFWLLEC